VIILFCDKKECFKLQEGTSRLDTRRKSFTQWVLRHSRPGNLWVPHPCRRSRPDWIGPWEAWTQEWQPCLQQGIGKWWSLGSLPTQAILWVKQIKKINTFSNRHVPGSRNAGNNLIYVCLQLTVVLRHFTSSKLNICCFWAQKHSLLLKEIVETNPQGVPRCYVWQVMALFSSHQKMLFWKFPWGPHGSSLNISPHFLPDKLK